MTIDNPVVPKPDAKWGLDQFLTYFEGSQIWGGLGAVGDSDPYFDQITSKILEDILALPAQGKHKISVEQYRPDLLSNAVYNTNQYWQILLIYNDIVDVGDLVPSKIISYPSVKDLEMLVLLGSKIDLPRGTTDFKGKVARTNDYNTEGLHYNDTTLFYG